jgi:polysaccharide export outer membrane protein
LVAALVAGQAQTDSKPAVPAATGAGASNYKNPYAPENAPVPVAAPAPAVTVPPVSAQTKQPAPGKPAVNAPRPDATTANVDQKTYILGPNDIVQVTVFDEPHLPGTYVIGPDGMMNMPLIGEFQAIGITIPALQGVITEKLKAFMLEPIVNVQLLRINSKQYTVMGGVVRGGPFPLLRDTTILDAMAACGGFKDFANTKKIYLLRGSRKYDFNYNDVRQGKHMEQNIKVEDGDYIYVPE